MPYVLHYHRKLLYFNVSLVFIKMYTNITKNPLRTFLCLNCLKNKNIKAWPKKWVLIKKKSVNEITANTSMSSPNNSYKRGISNHCSDAITEATSIGQLVNTIHIKPSQSQFHESFHQDGWTCNTVYALFWNTILKYGKPALAFSINFLHAGSFPRFASSTTSQIPGVVQPLEELPVHHMLSMMT